MTNAWVVTRTAPATQRASARTGVESTRAHAPADTESVAFVS